MGSVGQFLFEMKEAIQQLKTQQSYSKYYAGGYYGDISTRKYSPLGSRGSRPPLEQANTINADKDDFATGWWFPLPRALTYLLQWLEGRLGAQCRRH